MTSAVDQIKADSADIGVRAGKTFFQAAAAAVVTQFAASGFDFAHITDVSADGKLLSSLALGAIAAGVSAVMNSFKAAKAAK